MSFEPAVWEAQFPSAETMMATCPCPRPFRALEETAADDDGDGDETVLWEVIYTCVVLFLMFGALMSDMLGADSIMLTALTAFMAASIISIEEGLTGFGNEGLLTVLTLFVVADGISKTGALDWYMGKLLGRPKTAAAAQLRLMVPIAIVSAFLNNTPVVAVMIPIVQRWARNVNISAQQLLIPLSFASILGGTCTLIGTSTNLVVSGLLKDRYPDDPSADIALFDLGKFGVPVALIGIAYIILVSPRLLPGGKGSSADRASIPLDDHEDILIGARLAPWSPAAGRSVKRSGLRDTGGIFLVSVHRAATGNVHRAVGQDFVLNVGDILYFTGLIDGFGAFCEEHGLEILTNELQVKDEPAMNEEKTHDADDSATSSPLATEKTEEDDEGSIQFHNNTDATAGNLLSGRKLLTVIEGESLDDYPVEIGVTRESLVSAGEAERSRAIARMIDLVRGLARDEPVGDENRVFVSPGRKRLSDNPWRHKIVVTSDHEFVVIGVDARDRSGLLLDISKVLSRLKMNLRHTEASVVGMRSISIWRCELMEGEQPDLEEIWSVLNNLLEKESGSQTLKQKGLRVIRAAVTKNSTLIGKTAAEVDFRSKYKAAIVAIQNDRRNTTAGNVVFSAGDILVLQVREDSPLLKVPPADFYKRLLEQSDSKTGSRTPSVASFVNMITKTVGSKSFENLNVLAPKRRDSLDIDFAEAKSVDSNDGEFFIEPDDVEEENTRTVEDQAMIADIVTSMNEISANEAIWKDLQVAFPNREKSGSNAPNREFLAAMEVAPKSKLANKTVAEIGLDKLPGVFLVSIDRPSTTHQAEDRQAHVALSTEAVERMGNQTIDEQSANGVMSTSDAIFTTIELETPLQPGDVLWFAGSASAVGDLRKVPGLISYESDEVEKMNEKIHDRRLVEAVVARRGPLVGQTVKDIRFRTRYGAAVIAVHRDGKRIHDHPGHIKLQAGDVLLLEAGPTFIKRSIDNDRSFALLAEVEDSAPPRLALLIPALVITAVMLAVFTAGVASLLVCALVASALMVALGILSEQEARDAVNWEVYITIAAAFGIGTALVNSGVAGGIANFLVNIGEGIGIGSAGLLGAVYLGTFLISNVVTNNAAAALMFPIAMDAADQSGTDTLIMSYCLMLGASASFMSPFGYTTNLLIYGPGGYKYNDFMIVGTPMQLVLWILSVAVLETATDSNWWVSWLMSLLCLLVVVAIRVVDIRSLIKRE